MEPVKNDATYVLVTPARNEEATIGVTIDCVVRQTRLPLEWVIVSDGSTDRTDEIVSAQARSHPFIRLLRLDGRPTRNFASVVHALERGIGALQTGPYDYVGLLDADVRFGPHYFATLLERMAANPGLGLAGGLVIDVGARRGTVVHQYLKDVAGAVQFFRRGCLDALGGLIAIPEGGWDAITNVQARVRGYDTQTFSDLVVDHLKPRNSAEGGRFRRKWQLGVRDYALGYYFVFEATKCALRWKESPRVLGSVARLLGFCWSVVRCRARVLPSPLVAAVRGEQKRRLFSRRNAGTDPASKAPARLPGSE